MPRAAAAMQRAENGDPVATRNGENRGKWDEERSESEDSPVSTLTRRVKDDMAVHAKNQPDGVPPGG